jgi:hypothetical protein
MVSWGPRRGDGVHHRSDGFRLRFLLGARGGLLSPGIILF